MNLPNILKNRHNQAIFALIVANLIWGAASPIFKLALQNITPFTLAFIRFFGATILIFPFCISNLSIERKDWLKLVLLSFFGITVNISFFFLGLKYAPSINAPIIGSSGPVFLYLFSILILHEKRHYKVLIGTIISLLGVLIIIGQPLLTNSLDGQILGNLFFVLAMLGAIGHAIVSKEILPKYSAQSITFWSFLIGSITFLPMAAFEILNYNSLTSLDYRGWTGIIFGVLFSSLTGYFLFEWALKNMEVQEVGIFTYIDPIAAILIAMPLLGETITPIFLIGSILVFGGIIVAEGRLHYHPIHKLKSNF
ncbi:hypothetical protein A2960_02565 [Candidatus Gottesmanbacteria bacterium RIFCSPLOWO2_01_FULL_39_12b]|uniref:EamA domain-containing protein n=1 Tax=Candidatus Gottesmanbacteria bacterium RIFCSPLOWO2_01_FULL_39_12b TaxID=1798388 RepID=A0A1F6AQP6_9BACT|nr:MAG: hypothetical protein A2960_02565 [Candidatus Gottesmanbacteria bacterium RIFCSPLOWO2_01_FULL_39_12b]